MADVCIRADKMPHDKISLRLNVILFFNKDWRYKLRPNVYVTMCGISSGSRYAWVWKTSSTHRIKCIDICLILVWREKLFLIWENYQNNNIELLMELHFTAMEFHLPYRDHTMLHFTQHKWTHPALTQARQAGRDGRLSWPLSTMGVNNLLEVITRKQT